MVSAAPVPTHPEVVEGDPQTLRWVVPAGLLGMVGPVAGCPAPLARLREDGVLLAIVAEPDALRLTLAPEYSWRESGERVREALLAALAEARDGGDADGSAAVFTPDLPEFSEPPAPAGSPSGAAVGAHGSAAPRDVLRAAVEQVLAGDVGDYLASHGGAARIVEVTDDAVTLVLGGTCASCPARGITLHQRLETAVRRLYPGLREVRVEERRHGHRGAGPLLLPFPTRART